MDKEYIMPEQERGLVCCFCGAGFGYGGEKPNEDILKAACDHEAKCPKNPYLATIAHLVEALNRFLDSSACTNDCAPNDMTCDTNFAKKALKEAGEIK